MNIPLLLFSSLKQKLAILFRLVVSSGDHSGEYFVGAKMLIVAGWWG